MFAVIMIEMRGLSLFASTNRLLLAYSQPTAQRRRGPLNILLLYADDMRHDSIGVAGSAVKTPFLDRLAGEGIRFTHNCVTTSVCWISRATLHTGQYMAKHKSSFLGDPKWYAGWNESFPYLLNQSGYHVGHCGKWHWDLDVTKDPGRLVRQTYSLFQRDENYHWKNGLHITQKNEFDALRFLKERPRDKPFHLTVAFFAPKDIGPPVNWEPQPYSETIYRNATIPVPKTDNDEAWNRLPSFISKTNGAVRQRYFQRWAGDLFQPMMKKYYRMISEMDDACRRIVNELEKQGLMDETLIIFTTDNGYFQAEKKMAGKWFPYEESLRVPLIIRDPRMSKDKKGTINTEFTLSVDLASTILSAAQIPIPSGMQGRDISDLYLDSSSRGSGGEKPWRTEFYYEHLLYNWFKKDKNFIPPSEALVRKDFKYIVWRENNYTEQLFQMEKDPFEEEDLFGRAEHANLVRELQARFSELKAAVQ